MSICGGIAGRRGRNPVGIFIHNDAGGQGCTAAHYRNWLPGWNKENGFAHYYVCSDGTVQAEDDGNCAWHCGQADGNTNYLSIEACQSMGDISVFRQNEEKALSLAAEKCKAYGITPNNNTIRLHQEVYATACPHRSVEIHGGAAAAKAYFIKRITELMAKKTEKKPVQVPGNPSNEFGLYYRAHCQTAGTLAVVHDGQTAGTAGYGKRLEGLWIDVRTLRKRYGSNIKLAAKAHIQSKGWVEYDNVEHDTLIGTTGKSKRLEAIELSMTGLPEGKKLKFRTHLSKTGWTPWIYGGFSSGSVGLEKGIEAIQIVVE